MSRNQYVFYEDFDWRGKRKVPIFYTQNFLDIGDVCKALRWLRNIGVDVTPYYKPDLFTYLGIYAGDKQYKPYIYVSQQ